jgi:fused signal recognition particle receptor
MFRGLFNRVTEVFQSRGRLDEDTLDELEDTLIEADVGVLTATRLVTDLADAARKQRLATVEQGEEWLRTEISRVLEAGDTRLNWHPSPPTLVLVVGVNGTGKTTSVAKLAARLRREGRKPLIAAADTFRAAAIDQLEVWADRIQVDLVRHREGADPAAVVFDAVQAARNRGADVVVADTAGRLHTKANLMDELKKVHRISERALGRPADEVLLVLDATLGQNAVSQAKSFAEALPITGIILTKMDGTARGGVILTIKDELGIPIKYVGTGERAEDFDVFRPAEFTRALFAES